MELLCEGKPRYIDRSEALVLRPPLCLLLLKSSVHRGWTWACVCIFYNLIRMSIYSSRKRGVFFRWKSFFRVELDFWCFNLLFFDWLLSQNNQQAQPQVNRNSQEEKDDKEKEKEVDREEEKAEGDEKEDGMKWVSFSFTRLLSFSSHTHLSSVFSLHYLSSHPLNPVALQLVFLCNSA